MNGVAFGPPPYTAAIAKAEEAGGQVALPPMAIPEERRFAIYILGGIEHALWEDPPVSTR